jgi:hypothetical protein
MVPEDVPKSVPKQNRMTLADSPVVKRWLEPYKLSVIAMAILAVGFILGIVVIALPLAETQSAAVIARRFDIVFPPLDRFYLNYRTCPVFGGHYTVLVPVPP